MSTNAKESPSVFDTSQSSVRSNVSAGLKKIRKKQPRLDSYTTYIYRVLKKSMSIANAFVYDIFEKICAGVNSLALRHKRTFISAHVVQTAIRLLLPEELAKHAISERTKAGAKYNIK